jgi:hypothetical protein
MTDETGERCRWLLPVLLCVAAFLWGLAAPPL